MTSVKKKNKLSYNSFISIYKNANIKYANIFFPYIEYIWCIVIPSKLNFSFQTLDFSSWASSYLFGVNSFHISKVDCLVLQVKDLWVKKLKKIKWGPCESEWQDQIRVGEKKKMIISNPKLNIKQRFPGQEGLGKGEEKREWVYSCWCSLPV